MPLEYPQAHLIVPSGAGEAAAVLREASAAARKGEKVRVGVIESPYVSYSREDSGMHPEAAVGTPEFAARGGTVLLSHGSMNNILEISKPDLLAVVQGGVRMSELAGAAAEAGLHFPHRPEIDMTVAEMIMDGAIFPTDGGFGGLREYILSLELVTPAGEIVRFGSRAIKDVGGYELIGFLLGQGGKCGFISSVTLRLIPEPCCRAFVAGTDEMRTLKAHAHNARRDFRLSSTMIYEGEAAAIVAGIWRDDLGKRGKTLPPVLDPGGKSLLIGEMQGLEHVVEDQLHALAGTDPSGGASLALLERELFEVSRRFLHAAVDRLGGGGGALHVSYDGGGRMRPPAGALSYRSLYPERINVIVPVRTSGTAESPAEMIKADPPLWRFISELAGTLVRERVYVIEREGENLRRVRVPETDLFNLADGGDTGERLERARALGALNEKIFGAFDPESIMIP